MKKKHLAFAWVMVQVVLSAVLILLTKHLFDIGIEPLNFSYQMLLASAVYLLIYALFKEPKALFSVNKKSLLIIFFIGVLAGAISYGLGFLGLQSSTAINYAFLNQTAVFFTPVLAFFFLKEHLKPHKTVLIFVLLIGAYLVSTNGKLILPKIGDIYIVLAVLAFSFAIILTKIILKKVPALTFSMYRAFFGGLSLLIFLLLVNKINFDFYWYWIALVGFMLAVAIYAINKALEYASASYTQMLYLSTPVITAIFAYLILGESMTLIQIIGGALIVISGFFVHKLDI